MVVKGLPSARALTGTSLLIERDLPVVDGASTSRQGGGIWIPPLYPGSDRLAEGRAPFAATATDRGCRSPDALVARNRPLFARFLFTRESVEENDV